MDGLLDDAGAAGEFDLVTALAAPLPIAVITDLLGIPDADGEAFTGYGMALGGALAGLRSLRHAREVLAAGRGWSCCSTASSSDVAREPGDDLISRLVAAEGEQAAARELVPMCTLLLIAGFETTVNLIGNAVQRPARPPRPVALLVADPDARRRRGGRRRCASTRRCSAPPGSASTADTSPGCRRPGPVGSTSCSVAPTGTRPSSPSRTASTSPAPTSASTSPSPAASTTASGRPLAELEATVALQRLAERRPRLRRDGAVRRRAASLIRGPLHCRWPGQPGRPGPELGPWGQAHPPLDFLHLQTAACGRPSRACVEAVKAHLDLEATRGGYVAEELVTPVLAGLHTDLGELLGVDADAVSLVESATAGLLRLLQVWPLPDRARVGLVPGEWAANVATFVHHGLVPQPLAVDDDGVLDLEALARTLREDPPDLVHLVHLASHRGLVQPVAEALVLCRAHGVPLWVDAAQSLGHLDTRLGADALYAPGRKWLGGPRGTGLVAVAGCAREGLRSLPAPQEASIAGRVGLAVAVAEHLDSGPERARDRLAERGEALRRVITGTPGWQVADRSGARGALVGVRPTGGQDVTRVQARLIDEYAVLATAAQTWRAPGDMPEPLLRLSSAGRRHRRRPGTGRPRPHPTG